MADHNPSSGRHQWAPPRARVLVVDDEPVTCRLLAFNLGKEGYLVETAGTGEDALQMMEENLPDLTLLDLMLPGIDGIETLRRLRRFAPELPVIVLTAHGSVENAVAAMKLGAQDFLTKPFQPERLAVAVRNALKLGNLSREVNELRQQLSSRYSFDEIIGADGGLRGAVRLLEKVIPSDLTVLLQGESGTGKELFARAIHFEGPRKEAPFIAINCAAVPETLLESELFGHAKGAFTGAIRAHPGKFEEADGGTLFLDEIGEMSPALQVKLLRALQERTVTRLGSSQSVSVDVRVICATNRDLQDLIREGQFREDLYYRVSVFPLNLPPLRQRREDIPITVRHFLRDKNTGKPVPIHPAAMEMLEAYHWPGNVRELHNVLRRAMVLAGDETIRVEHLPAHVQAAFSDRLAPMPPHASQMPFLGRPDAEGRMLTLDEIERIHINEAIQHYHGNLSQVARALAIGRTTLYRKLQRFGLITEPESTIA